MPQTNRVSSSQRSSAMRASPSQKSSAMRAADQGYVDRFKTPIATRGIAFPVFHSTQQEHTASTDVKLCIWFKHVINAGCEQRRLRFCRSQPASVHVWSSFERHSRVALNDYCCVFATVTDGWHRTAHIVSYTHSTTHHPISSSSPDV